MKVWDRAGIKFATPGSAVSLTSVARHVTYCATRPGSKAMVQLLLIHCLLSLPLFVGVCVWSLFCCLVLSVLSSFTIISLRKRELAALLNYMWLLVFCVFSSRCHGLQCVTVAFLVILTVLSCKIVDPIRPNKIILVFRVT